MQHNPKPQLKKLVNAMQNSEDIKFSTWTELKGLYE